MEPPRLHRILSLSDLDDIDLQPEDFSSSMPLKKVPHGSVFEASRAGDVDRLQYLLDSGVNVNARDRWDSVALYYACLAGHLDAARMLLESGAICAEHTFDGDRCHYAALNLKVRKLLKEFEARPPPLGPLQGALRETFLGCWSNNAYLEQLNGHTVSKIAGSLPNGGSATSHFPADVVLYVQGRPIEAHRVILIARSPFFKSKFETDWKGRKEIKFTEKLSFPALFSLIHFFYCDRLEVFVDDIEALARICRVCKCISLQKILEKELIHQKYADYKSLQKVDNSQKRFILQGLSLPENDRLPAALRQILEVSLTNSTRVDKLVSPIDSLTSSVSSMNITDLNNDFADVYVKVEDKIFRCHQVVLASRSEYFKARLSRMEDFSDGRDELTCSTLPCIEEHDLSMGAFEKMVEYMYTDALKEIKPDQAEEMFDAASRYLLFPLKRAVADVLLPHLETADPAELCHWLTLADMYGVSKIREYCINTIALNFETFAETPEFRAMLLTLPPPSGDTSLRTTAPNAPGAEWTSKENLLDDLREKWLEAEGDELNQRDESALRFDKRLEMLVVVAEREKSSSSLDDDDCFAETS